jgi:hypothetical protein
MKRKYIYPILFFIQLIYPIQTFKQNGLPMEVGNEWKYRHFEIEQFTLGDPFINEYYPNDFIIIKS